MSNFQKKQMENIHDFQKKQKKVQKIEELFKFSKTKNVSFAKKMQNLWKDNTKSPKENSKK